MRYKLQRIPFSYGLGHKTSRNGNCGSKYNRQKAKLKLSPEDAVKTLMQFQHIQQLNVLINAELIALAELFNKHNIKFIVFKGQTNAINYPHPLSRIPGDIDFYVPQEDLDKAISILKKNGMLILKTMAPYIIWNSPTTEFFSKCTLLF